MTLSRCERLKFRREFMAMSGQAFDAMFDEDRQEQLMTLTSAPAAPSPPSQPPRENVK